MTLFFAWVAIEIAHSCGSGISCNEGVVGMTIARKSKETRVGMKDGNGINLYSVYPATYTM